MAKAEFVAAVDLGSSKVCTVIAEVDPDGAIGVLGTGIWSAQGMHKGLVANLDEASESLRESVKRAENTGGLKIKSAYIGVSGAHVSSWNKRSAVAVGKGVNPVSQWDIKRALTSAQEPGIQEERKILHEIPKGYILDGRDGVKDPTGMRGFRLDVDTHIVTVDQATLENLCECVRKAGLKVDGMVLQSLAAAEAVLTSDEVDTGVVLADVGAGTTDIATFRNGTVEHTSVLAVGGNQITRDLAIGLGIPFEAAEQAKKEHGNLLSIGKDGKEAEDTVTLNGNGGILKADLNEIIRARVVEILKLIFLQVSDNQDRRMKYPAGLVLTGGTANLPGIDSLAAEVLEIPARVGVPKVMYGLADDLSSPAYASAAGIVIWGGKERQKQRHEEAGFPRKLVGGLRSFAPRWARSGA
jgi:cell division protein FtsA